MAIIKNAGKRKNASLPMEVEEAIREIGGLEKLACSIPNPEDVAVEAGLHEVLSDRTRLTILYSIGCCDMCPCVLKEYLCISDSRLSYHLSVLEKHGLITAYPKKNWRIFQITEAGRIAIGNRKC
jgi:DNA-binding transcriptional ArsR family regulator